MYQMEIGLHVGATWIIRLNDPRARRWCGLSLTITVATCYRIIEFGFSSSIGTFGDGIGVTCQRGCHCVGWHRVTRCIIRWRRTFRRHCGPFIRSTTVSWRQSPIYSPTERTRWKCSRSPTSATVLSPSRSPLPPTKEVQSTDVGLLS